MGSQDPVARSNYDKGGDTYYNSSDGSRGSEPFGEPFHPRDVFNSLWKDVHILKHAIDLLSSDLRDDMSSSYAHAKSGDLTPALHTIVKHKAPLAVMAVAVVLLRFPAAIGFVGMFLLRLLVQQPRLALSFGAMVWSFLVKKATAMQQNQRRVHEADQETRKPKGTRPSDRI